MSIMFEDKEGRPTCCIYRTDGRTEIVQNPLYPDDNGWLEWVQRQVGGYVERYPIRLPNITSMWVNEEGRLLGLQPNQAVLTQFNHFVVGDAVIYIRT